MTGRSALAITALIIAVGVAREKVGHAQEPDPDAIGSACNGGDIRSCVQLGILYADGHGVPKDEGKAASLFQKACNRGSTAACSNLGSLYATGRGMPKDGPKAAALFLKACNAGETAGCYGLGFTYEWGLGLPKDQVKAAAFYERACEGGDLAGCTRSAPAQPGIGPRVPAAVQSPVIQVNDSLQAAARAVLPESMEPDAKALGRRCDRGSVLGCLDLGILYSNGRGVPKDEGRAATLFVRACEGGSPLGCDLLGFAYEWGLGVPKDQMKAATLYQRGCEGGDATGCSKSSTRRLER